MLALAQRPAVRASSCRRSALVFSQRRRAALVRAQPEQKEEVAAPASTSDPSGAPTVREFTSWGAKIIESDSTLKGPEDQPDFFEGDQMEAFGKFMERFFIPSLIVLGLICGSLAARSYNEDADTYIAPPVGPDQPVRVIPAEAFAPAPLAAPAPGQ